MDQIKTCLCCCFDNGTRKKTMSDFETSDSSDDETHKLRPVKTNDFKMIRQPTTSTAAYSTVGYMPATNQRGKALLFNFEFKEIPERQRNGSAKDVEDLRKVFGGQGYNVVAPDTPTKKGVVKALERVAKEDHSQWDSLVVVVMTHGAQRNGVLYLMDENEKEYPAEELWSSFDVMEWMDIPKLFFIQTCQGTIAQPPSYPGVAKDGASVEVDAMPVSFPARGRNFLFAFSTIPDWASVRDPKDGSWFIQSLCKAIDETPQDEVHQILTSVNFKVSAKEGQLPHNRRVKQMSCFSSTLTQKFYFTEPETLSNLDSVSVSNEAAEQLTEKKRELRNETKKTRRLEKELEEKQRQIEQLRIENEYKHLNIFLRKQWFSLKEDTLKKGTMGNVISIGNHPWIVKKVPGEDYLHDPQDLDIMLNFKHKFVLAVYAYYRDEEDEICLVLPRADVGSFLDYVIAMEKRLTSKQMTGNDELFFTEDAIWNFLWNMAAALQYLHKSGPHGSVNPRNIFGVREANGTICWKLAKYGLKLSKEDEMKEYFAPEVKRNEARSKEADIFSLGAVMMFYINFGRNPFQPTANSSRERQHSISSLPKGTGQSTRRNTEQEMMHLLYKRAHKMMHRDSEKRPTAKELALKEKK